MDICIEAECKKALPWECELCPACGANNGPPNIRHAKREQDVLEQRYQASLDDCKNRQIGAIAQDFAQTVRQDSHAVINGRPDFFLKFFQDDRQLYSTYPLQTQATLRIAADFDDDSHRRVVEATVFGAYGEKIRYAALSLNGQGLHSYGCCNMTINLKLCENRASLTEENTYELVKHHNKSAIAPGYRAFWAQRNKLAVAKLGAKLTANTNADGYAALLLYSEGNRATDQFIEVHIHSQFSHSAIKAAVLPISGRDKQERFYLSALSAELKNKRLPCKRL